MKGLFVFLFLTLVSINAFSQIPAEIDFNARFSEYEIAQKDFLYLKDLAGNLKQQGINVDNDISEKTDRLIRQKDKRKINIARLDEIELTQTQTVDRLKTLEINLNTAMTELPKVKALEIKASEKVNRKKAKLAEMEPKVSVIKKQIKEIEDEINANVQNKNSKVSSLKKIQEAITTNETNVKSLKQVNIKTQERIDSQKTTLSTLSADDPKRAVLENAIKKGQEKIAANISEMDKVTSSLNILKQKKDGVNAEILSIDQKISSLKSKKQSITSAAGDIYSKYEEAKSELNEAVSEKEIASKNVDETNDRIAKFSNSIKKNQNTLVSLRDEKKIIHAEQIKIKDNIQRLKFLIADLTQQSVSIWAEFDKVDRRVARANGRAQALYEVYEQTKLRYDSYMNAAVASGEDQGASLGENLGSKDGELLAKDNGVNDGTTLGKKLGLLQGFLQGLKTGYSEGKENGYNDGFNLPSNYEQGFKLGLAAGKEQAYQDAEDEDYPRGRTNKQKELLSRVLSGSKLFKDAQSKSVLESASEIIYQAANKVSTSSNMNDAILDLIELTTNEINALFDQIDALKQNPVSGIVVDTPNKVGELQCPSQYPANYSDFLNACKNSFIQSFHNTYQDSFKVSYNAEYLISFEDLIDEQVKIFGISRTKEGYNKAYTPTYNKYKLIGSKDAQNKGFNEGHKKAYQDNIKTARELAYNRGQADETKFFETNSVIKIIDAKLVSKEVKFIPGAKVDLGIELGNYGSVATIDRDVIVEITSLSVGLVFDKKSQEIQSIKGITSVSKDSLFQATVSEGVQPGEQLKVKINTYISGKLADSKIVSVVADSDYNGNMVISADLSPKFRTFSKKEEVKISVTNLSRTKLTSELSVKMRASHKDINILDSVKQVGVLDKGESKDIVIEYKGKKKLKGKKITLSYDLIYQGKVIKTQEIVIKPI